MANFVFLTKFTVKHVVVFNRGCIHGVYYIVSVLIKQIDPKNKLFRKNKKDNNERFNWISWITVEEARETVCKIKMLQFYM